MLDDTDAGDGYEGYDGYEDGDAYSPRYPGRELIAILAGAATMLGLAAWALLHWL